MTDFPQTLLDALDRNQDEHLGIRYINGQNDERFVSYPALKQRALGLLTHLQHLGAKQGNEVIVHLSENEQFIDTFWACQYGGIVAVPVAIGTSDGHRQKVFNVFSKLETPFIVTSIKALERLEAYAKNNGLEAQFEIIKSSALLVDLIESLDEKAVPVNVSPNDTSFIQFSSGSTGDPKGVVLTHKNLMTNLYGIIDCSRFDANDSFFSWMPLTHDMGIIGFHMTPLVVNIPQYIMPTELFVRRPNLWLEKVSEHQVAILSSPNFGYKHVLKRFKPEDQTTLDLSKVRLIFNGAEPISAELCREFNDVMKPFGLSETAMFTVYGLAEASLAISFPPLKRPVSTIHVKRNSLIENQPAELVSADDVESVELVRLGQAITHTAFKIVNSDGDDVAENVIGRVLIKGDNVTSGYYHEPDLNATLIDENGWLDTGDQGLINDGDLVITGRTKDLIIVNGQNYFAPDLESVCENVDGIDLGKVIVCGVRNPEEAIDELVVFVLYRGQLEDFHTVVQGVRRELGEKSGLDVAFVLPVKNIPKTTSGKVQRFALAEAFLQGEYAEIIAALDELSETRVDGAENIGGSAIEIQLLEICNTVISDHQVSVNDNIFEVGASSLKLAQIHEQIDELYPDMVDLADFFDHPTIEGLAGFISEKTSA